MWGVLGAEGCQLPAARIPIRACPETGFAAASLHCCPAQARAEAKGEAADEADEWGAKLRQLDPLFAAVAAVPWMPTDEDGGERRRLVQSRVLDELEAQGAWAACGGVGWANSRWRLRRRVEGW